MKRIYILLLIISPLAYSADEPPKKRQRIEENGTPLVFIAQNEKEANIPSDAVKNQKHLERIERILCHAQDIFNAGKSYVDLAESIYCNEALTIDLFEVANKLPLDERIKKAIALAWLKSNPMAFYR